VVSTEALMGVDEITRYARITKNDMMREVIRGGFPAYKDGTGRWRSTRSAVDEWLRRKSHGGGDGVS
jgi:excisionase family DNA binding protein